MEHTSSNNRLGSRSPTTRPRTSVFDELSEQLDCWRSHLNQYGHPVILFDGNLWPILLNETLQKLMLDRTPVDGRDRTTSSFWKTACDAAGSIVAKHARMETTTEIAEVLPLNQRCFSIVGSLLRSGTGRVTGAIINLAEVTASSMNRPTVIGSSVVSQTHKPEGRGGADTEEDFHQWLTRRKLAREKIAALSPRESQVVAHVAHGQSNKRIARELGVTTKTIEKHRANAALKLGAESAAEMVRISVVAGHEIPETHLPSLN